MYRSIVLLVAGLASLGAISLSAQEAVLSQQYGSGVHSYFAANYAKAYEQLTTAIDGGLKDPRAFYFRGLACLDLGRPQDAKLDFHAGAVLEADDVNKLYNVGKSLERIQGSAREELESYRINARMAAFEREERLERDRYEKQAKARARHSQQAGRTGDVRPAVSGGDENAISDPFELPGDTPKKAVKKTQPKKPADKRKSVWRRRGRAAAAAPADKKPEKRASPTRSHPRPPARSRTAT